MKGLSQDIQSGIDVIIEGLEYELDIHDVPSEKLRATMESKTKSFKIAKEMLNKWQEGASAPNKKTLTEYIERLINAGDKSINSLRDALKAKINYQELDTSLHGKAMEAKPIIVQAIHEIHTGTFELRLQLDSGNINLNDREFKIGYPEKYANGEFFPSKDYNKDWFNEEEQAIKICPLGTEGEVVEIWGLKIQLPKPPKDKKTILFHDLPKKEQYWRREELPKGLTRENANEYTDYILEQFRRRREGVWFYNNGKSVWLPPRFWFGMQWVQMIDDGQYRQFLYPQLEMAYHGLACMIDKKCKGEFFVKARRTGFTTIKVEEELEIVTSEKNARVGNTSQKDDDAERLFARISYGFLNLPFFFRPVVKGAEDSGKKLHFTRPSDKSKKSKIEGDTETSDYINSIIDYEATTVKAYDGQRMYYYLADESSKWPKQQSFLDHWGRFSPTLERGGKIVGKAFVGSTVAPMKEGGQDFKSMYEDSLVSTKNPITKKTRSGLYAYFLPAHKNYLECIDIYGYCWETTPPKGTRNIEGDLIEYGSIDLIKAEAASAKLSGAVQYNNYLRANPMNIRDAFRDEAEGSTFNLEKINEQSVFNEGIVTPMTQKGNFQWQGEKFNSDVVWHPNENGAFVVSWLQHEDYRNKKKKGMRGWEPCNGDIGVGGVDSYDIDETVDTRASNGALHFYNKWNMVGASHSFVLEYIDRPTYADILYENILMASVFYGYPLLVENNKYGIVRFFQRAGYEGYIMKRPDYLTPEGARSTKTLGVPSNSADIIQEHAQAIERYIHKHVGEWTEKDEQEALRAGEGGHREVGSMGVMYFERTLDDWRNFDIKKRTKYDASISSGYALLAAQKPIKAKREVSSISSASLLRRYDNSGSKSRLR